MEFKHKVGTGVLGKDGQPFAPRTLHVVEKSPDGIDMNVPMSYTLEALLYAFLSDRVTKFELITENNVKHLVEKIPI